MDARGIDAMKRGREIVCACASACAIAIGARFARTKRPHGALATMCGCVHTRKCTEHRTYAKNAQVGLSHIIQHDICRDARYHINTAEFIAGVFE